MVRCKAREKFKADAYMQYARVWTCRSNAADCRFGAACPNPPVRQEYEVPDRG